MSSTGRIRVQSRQSRLKLPEAMEIEDYDLFGLDESGEVVTYLDDSADDEEVVEEDGGEPPKDDKDLVEETGADV